MTRRRIRQNGRAATGRRKSSAALNAAVSRSTAIAHLPGLSVFLALLLALAALYVSLGSAPESILKGWFNSDWLFSAQVYRDLFVDHFPISGMIFPTAPSLFPDVTLTVLCVALAPNVLVGTLLYGFLQFVCLIAAFQLCGSAIGVGKPSVRRWILYATGIGVTLAVAKSATRGIPYAYYLFLPTTHVGSFWMVTLCCGLAFWVLRHGIRAFRGRLLFGIFCLLNLAAGLSDLLFIVHLTIALTCALAFGLYFRLIAGRRAVLLVSSSWIFSLAGWILKDHIFKTTPLPSGDLNQSLTSLIVLITGIRGAVVHGDVLHLCSLSFYAVSIATVLWLLRKYRISITTTHPLGKGRRLLVCFLVFEFVSGVASLAAPVWVAIPGLWQLHDYGYSMKYMFPFFIGPLFSWAILGSFLIGDGISLPEFVQRKHRWQWKAVVGSGVLLLWPAAVLLRLPAQVTPLDAKVSPFTLVRVLDDDAKRFGLHCGVGGFWETRMVNLLSRSGLRAYPIDGALQPFDVLSNMWWYRGSAQSRVPAPDYNFIFLNGAFFKLSRDTVVARFGEPSEEFQIDGTRVLAYGRGNQDRLNKIFACSGRLNLVELEARGNVTIPGACLLGQVGRVYGSARETDDSKTPGYLVFGPYYRLPPGHYELDSSIDATGPQQQAIGTWDVVYSPGETVVHTGSIVPGMKHIRTDIVAQDAETRLMQLRVFENRNGDIRFFSLHIQRLPK